MFLVLLGVVCSIVAAIKLVREQYIKFGQILTPRPGERRHQSAMIARVLLRCVLYPLGKRFHTYTKCSFSFIFRHIINMISLWNL